VRVGKRFAWTYELVAKFRDETQFDMTWECQGQNWNVDETGKVDGPPQENKITPISQGNIH
jgi:hypothetical protein